MIGAILPTLFELIMYTPIQWPYKYLIKSSYNTYSLELAIAMVVIQLNSGTQN